jgi:hypothetical protein
MQLSNDFRKLSQPEFDLLQERADRFAEAIKKGPVADWGPYLDGLEPALRLAVLFELIKIDLDQRWAQGKRPLLEEYINGHAQIGSSDMLPVDLIREEIRVRRKHGDNLDVAEYYRRFPCQFDAVRADFATATPVAIDNTYKTEGTVAGAGTLGAGTLGAGQLHTIASTSSEAAAKPAAAAAKPSAAEGYTKIEALGHGYFGEVWKAKAPGGIEVAIKVVNQPIGRDGAQRELGALELVKNLRHPCLLSTSAFWIENDRLNIVMELADGSMRDRLKQCQAQNLPGIPRDELLMYFADAAEGLDFLHERNVFHRDIKPDNILLLHGHAKIADFGLARLQERQMMTVSFAGTPVYMAPEAWGGKGGPRSDQYSLAFAYGELRQGRRPIEAGDLTEVMGKALANDPDLADLPPEEAKVVRQALAKDPEHRFVNCSEFVAALARATGTPVRLRAPRVGGLQAPGDKHSGAETAPYIERKDTQASSPTGAKKRKLTALAGAAALIGIGAVAVWFFALKGAPKPNDDAKGKVADADKGAPKNVDTGGPPPVIEPKPKDKLSVPDRFRPTAGAAIKQIGSRQLPERIEFVQQNGDRALFALIQPSSGLAPYYMMETKVSNGLFKEFAGARAAEAEAGASWRNAPALLPVTGVNVTEARQFARWLGGYLPTTKQWDYAAGVTKRAGRDGPSIKVGTAAVGLNEPRPIDDHRDEGPFGTFDMAGNGREWTRDVMLPDGSIRPGSIDRPAAAGDISILRGHNFTLATPLSYADLDYEQRMPQTQFSTKPSPYTSFRVVIEVED